MDREALDSFGMGNNGVSSCQQAIKTSAISFESAKKLPLDPVRLMLWEYLSMKEVVELSGDKLCIGSDDDWVDTMINGRE